MAYSSSGTAKRTISLIIAMLLAVVFCASIDLSCDPFSSTGGIKGSSSVSVSHSLAAFPSAAVRSDNGRTGGSGSDQDLRQKSSAADIFCRIARKFAAFSGCGTGQSLPSSLRYFYISICVAGVTCLFSLTHINFIHLKDGSK